MEPIHRILNLSPYLSSLSPTVGLQQKICLILRDSVQTES